MAFKYTEEQLNKLDKELLIQLFLGLQDQMEELTKQTQALNDKMQLMMEQIVLSNKSRFGRSSEKMTDPGQIRFMEVDGKIVFFNEIEAVCDLTAPEPDDLGLRASQKKFVYVEGHVCLDDEKYIIHSEGRVKLTQYALSHMDECCLAFDKGYSYQSKYQGQKYYVQMMYKTPSQVTAQEYSFEMNAHNRTLLSQIQRASRSADAMRLYPGAFSETLVQLMKEKKLSNKKLADASLVGERTIQRLRNEEEYPTTVQTVLGLCYGLQLSVPEAEMLVGKTDFNIKPTNPQNNAYRCVLSSCAENSIYEVNEMLESCGFEPLGSSKMG